MTDHRRLTMRHPPRPEDFGETPDEVNRHVRREHETIDQTCPICEDTFERHPDDPPTCSQDCWAAFTCHDGDPR